MKDYFYTTSKCQQPAVVWVRAFAHAGSFWLSPTNLSPSWDQEWDLLGCYLGLAITQSWQGEMLSSCKEKAEKDLPTLMLGGAQRREDERLFLVSCVCSRPSMAEKVLPGEAFGVQQRNTQKVPAPGDINHTLCSGHLGLWSAVLLPACRSQQQVEAEPGVWPSDLLQFLSTSPWLAAPTPDNGHKKDIPQPWCDSAALWWCIPFPPQRFPGPHHFPASSPGRNTRSALTLKLSA